MFELRGSANSPTGRSLNIVTPQKVLRIHTKEELRLQLDHYARPFLKHQVPDTTFARKNYILYLRPALRYYCARFGVKVPKWLENDDYYKGLPDDEKQDLFGTTKLRWDGHFTPVKRSSTRGQVHR